MIAPVRSVDWRKLPAGKDPASARLRAVARQCPKQTLGKLEIELTLGAGPGCSRVSLEGVVEVRNRRPGPRGVTDRRRSPGFAESSRRSRPNQAEMAPAALEGDQDTRPAERSYAERARFASPKRLVVTHDYRRGGDGRCRPA